MSIAPILVTGAAGGIQGSTGFHVTRLLREEGHPVRAFVHRLDERCDRVRALGAQIVEGDLHDFRSVAAAVDEQVVNLSQWLQDGGDQPTPHQVRHWLVEQIFDWADVGAVHLDATVFYENLFTWALISLSREGVIALPWGPESTTIPMVAAGDVARVAAAVLTGPVLPNGTVVRLMAGGFTNKEIADTFGQILGRSVDYVEIGEERWASETSALGVNDVVVEHLTHLWRYLRNLPPEYQAFFQTTGAFEEFTGRPPQSLAQFLQERRDMFAGVV